MNKEQLPNNTPNPLTHFDIQIISACFHVHIQLYSSIFVLDLVERSFLFKAPTVYTRCLGRAGRTFLTDRNDVNTNQKTRRDEKNKLPQELHFTLFYSYTSLYLIIILSLLSFTHYSHHPPPPPTFIPLLHPSPRKITHIHRSHIQSRFISHTYSLPKHPRGNTRLI